MKWSVVAVLTTLFKKYKKVSKSKLYLIWSFLLGIWLFREFQSMEPRPALESNNKIFMTLEHDTFQGQNYVINHKKILQL